MQFLYTAREIFNKNFKPQAIHYRNKLNFNHPIKSWEDYIAWSGLDHVQELITLDSHLNERPDELTDWHKTDYWTYIVQDGLYDTGFFTSLDYVLKMTKHKERFNLLAVVIEPKEDCKGIRIDGFDFVGYELLDKFYSSSALTNLGCMDKGFLPHELNHLGLLDSLDKAHHIQEYLRENYPDMEDADTKIIAVWRHRRIGRWRRPRRHI